MSHETNDPNQSLFNELDCATLEQAVKQVRSSSVPEHAQRRALDRASSLTPIAVAVQRHPSPVRRSRFRLKKYVGVACLVMMCGVLLWTVGESVQRSREAARRSSSNNIPAKIGLAMHNYYDGISQNGQLPTAYFARTPAVVGLQRTRIHGISDGASETFTLAESALKIVHSADIVLVVDEIKTTEKQLDELVQQFRGYFGNSEISEPKGQPRSARWVVRIPVDSLDSFLREVVKLGTPENRSTNSQDVTEEYTDLAARINSKKQLEKRILGLLEKHTGDIKDVLAVEEQLARVRQEIEKMEGRVKHLDDAIKMTTIAVSAREERDYVPPQSPSFSTEIGKTWGGSLESLQGLGKWIVLFAVALGPWLPFILVLFFVGLRMLRKRNRATSAKE
jgi:hypothetical protein